MPNPKDRAKDKLAEEGIDDPTEDEVRSVEWIFNDDRYTPALMEWYATEMAKSLKRKRGR
jgi:hypothetical protein